VILEELNTYDKNVAANDLKEYGDVYSPTAIKPDQVNKNP